MNITNTLLSFRYSNSFILNKIKKKKLKSSVNFIKVGSHDSCPICDCRNVDLIAEVDRVGFPCQTVVCQQCQFVFNNSFIVNTTDFYSNEWGSEHWGDPERSFQKRTATDNYAWKRMAYLAKNLNTEFQKISNILEIGCGDGCNLFPYHLIGKRVVGCDFDVNFLRPGRERGLELVVGGVESISKSNSFDLIMLIHSFEHVINMDETIQSVADRIKPNGLVYVEDPGVLGLNRVNSGAMQSMGLKSSNNFLGYLQFQHNYHFDLGHLKAVWERNGFEMILGDEWVRAIFRKKKTFENTQPEFKEGGVGFNLENSTLSYLSKVERDFLSVRNFFCRLNNLISRKLCIYNNRRSK